MVYSFLILFYSNFVPKRRRFWDIRLQKCRDLENRVRGPSRSLEMSPCDRAHMTSYWRSIVTMALSRVVSEIFNVENVVTLKLGSEVTQGHWKLYHSVDHENRQFSHPCVFNARAEGVPRGILYRRRGLKKLEWWGFQMVENVFT